MKSSEFIIEVLSAEGEGCTELSAFDDALSKVGVCNFNLIPLSSIIPKGAKVIEKEFFNPQNHIKFGDILYVVLSKITSSKKSEYISAGLGWAISKGKGGIFYEAKGKYPKEILKEQIREGLNEMIKRRGWDDYEINIKVVGGHVSDLSRAYIVLAVYGNKAVFDYLRK